MTSQTVNSPHLRVAAATSVSARPHAEVLTGRECQVLDLVTQARSNAEIAERLSLSLSSVRTHLRLAYRKIDVSTRAEALQWGVRHGAGC